MISTVFDPSAAASVVSSVIDLPDPEIGRLIPFACCLYVLKKSPCRDCAEMYASLIGEYPDHWDQPSSINFDYLDVYHVARVTISGSLLLNVEMANTWDGAQSFRNSLAAYTEHTQERRYIISTIPVTHAMDPQLWRPAPAREAKAKAVRCKWPTPEPTVQSRRSILSHPPSTLTSKTNGSYMDKSTELTTGP